MDAGSHLGTAADLETRTARVADPALGTHHVMFRYMVNACEHQYRRSDTQTHGRYRATRHDR
jgi:hypothetical protein